MAVFFAKILRLVARRGTLENPFELTERNIKLQIPLAIGIKRAPFVDDQNCGAFGYAVNKSVQNGSVQPKRYLVTGLDLVFCFGDVTWRHELMIGFGVAKEPPRDCLESIGTAVRIIPHQHLGQMNHLMFHDSLQCLQPIMTNATPDLAQFAILKGLKQRRRRDCNFKFFGVVGALLHGRRSAGCRHSPGQSEP